MQAAEGADACRVLAVACNFPPDASVGTQRTLRLVRHLAASGWRVDVVTIAPHGLRPGTVVDPALVEEVPPEVFVVRATPLRPFERLGAALKQALKRSALPQHGGAAPNAAPEQRHHPASRARRMLSALLTLPDREVSWLIPAVWKGWRRARETRPDVIYSSGPPFSAHLVALTLARLLRVPWVADFRDPWARAPWREDRFEFERQAWSVLERLVVKRAQTVVFVTETNQRDFAREYGRSASHFVLISNGCDPADFDGMVRRTARHDGRFVLLHAGSLYGARNPAPLFQALASAIAKGRVDRGTFRLRFIGRLGIPGADIPGIARNLGLADVVEFGAQIPRRDSLQEMIDATALLIVQPVTTVAIPAKLYEYMAAGRPVLALAEPGAETAELVTRSGAGLAVRADDEAAIEDALVSIVALGQKGFTPVDRQVYDGNVRAAELRVVLGRAAAGGRVAMIADDSPVAGT